MKGFVFPHDNSRQYKFLLIRQNLRELDSTVLAHPQCCSSVDPALADSQLFNSLLISFNEVMVTSKEAYERHWDWIFFKNWKSSTVMVPWFHQRNDKRSSIKMARIWFNKVHLKYENCICVLMDLMMTWGVHPSQIAKIKGQNSKHKYGLKFEKQLLLPQILTLSGFYS